MYLFTILDTVLNVYMYIIMHTSFLYIHVVIYMCVCLQEMFPFQIFLQGMLFPFLYRAYLKQCPALSIQSDEEQLCSDYHQPECNRKSGHWSPAVCELFICLFNILLPFSSALALFSLAVCAYFCLRKPTVTNKIKPNCLSQQIFTNQSEASKYITSSYH